jgi:rubrerythrin
MKRTMENLAKAFIGESQARNRYGFYAKVAKKEGYEQIAAIFGETAEQERAHASTLFKMINELKKRAAIDVNAILVEADMPTSLGSTKDNLKAAISGETHESKSMYPGFAQVAQEEGLNDIAARLKAIARAEEHHAERYGSLLHELEHGTLHKKGDASTRWTCRECGYVHEGNEPPEICPACQHPRGHYQRMSEEY